MRRTSVVLTCLWACSMAAACGSAPPPRSQPSALLGDVMPAFDSKTLNGNPLHSTAFHGAAFIVTFVASDCKPCETTLSAAQSAYADFHDVPVVAVFRPEDGPRAASALTAKLELKFPVVLDGDGAIAKLFQVSDLPSTFVINPNGRVSWVGGRDLTEGALRSAIRAAQ